MSVKTLRRLKLAPSSLPGISQPSLHTPSPYYESRWEAIKSHIPSLPTLSFPSPKDLGFRGARKAVDDQPLSAMESIREFFTMNFPSVLSSMKGISELTNKLKLPAIAAIGVAAAAGIAYLVYKVYTNRESIGSAIKQFMEDMKNVAPDLTKVPGWFESIKNEVTAAFDSGNPASVVEKLVKIKNAILGHQVSIEPTRVGSGINLFIDIEHLRHSPNSGRKFSTQVKKGGALRVPLY